MAKQDLYKTAQQSAKLFKLIKENQQLEGWVADKIAKAADDISTVYQYLNYEKQFQDYSKVIAESTNLSEGKRAALTEKLMEAKDKVKELKKKAAKEKADKKAEKMDEDRTETTKTQHGTATATYGDDGKRKGVVHKDERKYSDEPHAEPPSKAKAQSAADKAGAKAADKAQAKDSKDYEKKNPGSVKTYQDGKLVKEAAACNETPKGKSCPVHGMKECTMKEGKKAKPDFLDVNKNGNKAESMKKAVADKKAGPKKGVNPFAKKDSKVKEAIARAKDMLEGKSSKKKAAKDYDEDGKIETGPQEHAGAVDKAIKANKKEKEVVKESADLTRMKVLMTRLNG